MRHALNFSKIWLSAKLGRFIKDERGEVNIVATIILLGIAVLLAVAFREQIGELVDKIFTKKKLTPQQKSKIIK